MRSTRAARRLVILSVLLVGMACSDANVTGWRDPAPTASRVAPTGAVLDFDDEFARIAREEIPGFAGYYFVGDTNTVLLLVDETRAPAANVRAAFARQRAGMPPARRTIVRRVTHDFAKLKIWHDSLLGHLDVDGVYMVDIDEVGNRVWLGVANRRVESRVRAQAARLGIPRTAVGVDVVPRPQTRMRNECDPTCKLFDFWRPIAGGLRILNPTDPDPECQAGGGCICSVGFNAWVSGSPRWVTASHCSNDYLKLDNSLQYQPNTQFQPNIGQEAADPMVHTCPGITWKCRFSDASLYWTNQNTAYERGRLMHTLSAGVGGPGSLDIDQLQPYFDVTTKWGASSDAPVGTSLHKVGSWSGWTTGQVTRTNLSIFQVGGDGKFLRGQWETSIWSEGGDSGSPVFAVLGNPNVALHGVLWGGPPDNFNISWHSTLYFMQADFGVTLSVCVPSAGC
jgi:hypothetical protein